MSRRINDRNGKVIEEILKSAYDPEKNQPQSYAEVHYKILPALRRQGLKGLPKTTASRMLEAAGITNGDSHEYEVPLLETSYSCGRMMFRLSEEGLKVAADLQDKERSKVSSSVLSSYSKHGDDAKAARKTLEWFKEHRPQQYNAAEKLVAYSTDRDLFQKLINRFICLWGPLKWGKREVLDILALMLRGRTKLYYVLSLDRKDMRPQEKELERYGWILVEYNKFDHAEINGAPCIFAFDECDYGDGKIQNFAKFYNKISDKENIVLIGVSATPFTFVHSLDERFKNAPIVVGEMLSTFVRLKHFPYIIVNEEAFSCDGTFTHSFANVIEQWAKTSNSSKTKFVVRKAQFDKQSVRDNIENQVKYIWHSVHGHAKVSCRFVDMNNTDFKWMKDDDSWENEGNELIIVKQTFARGTETNIHKFLFGYYDYRTDATAANTILQSLGRFPNYSGIKDINMYVSLDHKFVVDVYCEMEEGVASGKPFSYFTAKHPTMKWAARLSPNKNEQKKSSAEWEYEFIPCDTKSEALDLVGYESTKTDFISWSEEKNYTKKEKKFGVCVVSNNGGDDSDILKRMFGGSLGHSGNKRLIHYVDAPSYEAKYKKSWDIMLQIHPEWEGKHVVAIPRRRSQEARQAIVPLNNKSTWPKFINNSNDFAV